MAPDSIETKLPAPFTVDRPCEPPDYVWVTLSQSLTWIAFHNSIDCRDLDQALALAKPKAVSDQAREELLKAVAHLTDLGRQGKIALTGIFVTSLTDNETTRPRVPIPPRDFKEFNQFDVVHDGLRRGGGLAWENHPKGREWAIKTSAYCAYHSIEVQRPMLLEEFPRPPFEPLSNDEVEHWCRDWIASDKGNDSEKAWKAFQMDPRRCGLSRDDIFRPAWKKVKDEKAS